MPLVFIESADSGKVTQGFDQATATLKHTAFRHTSDAVVKAAYIALVGPFYAGLPLDNVECVPQGGGVWICTAVFSLRVPTDSQNEEDTEALGPSYTIDLTAGTIHITQSLETTGAYSVDATTPPDYAQAIGVTKDSITGTDIFAPKFEFGLTVKTYPLTLEFIRVLRAAVAKTNDAPWKGFDTGEVLYLGLTGQCEPNELWKLNHKFAVGENKDVKVTPSLTVPKAAWEYLWVAYKPGRIGSGTGAVVAQVPRYVYTERVYDATDFNALRLNPPVCNWTSAVNSGMHPLTVNFTDLSTGTPLQWLWTFGDGSTSTLRNPSKVYSIPGFYTVSLTVTNGAGSSFKTVTNYVAVS